VGGEDAGDLGGGLPCAEAHESDGGGIIEDGHEEAVIAGQVDVDVFPAALMEEDAELWFADEAGDLTRGSERAGRQHGQGGGVQSLKASPGRDKGAVVAVHQEDRSRLGALKHALQRALQHRQVLFPYYQAGYVEDHVCHRS
jgi:hypothetical protein